MVYFFFQQLPDLFISLRVLRLTWVCVEPLASLTMLAVQRSDKEEGELNNKRKKNPVGVYKYQEHLPGREIKGRVNWSGGRDRRLPTGWSSASLPHWGKTFLKKQMSSIERGRWNVGCFSFYPCITFKNHLRGEGRKILIPTRFNQVILIFH